jgi:glycosyltransferase involved in cell wall biosynthesis
VGRQVVLRIFTLCIARNEEYRYLESCLKAWSDFSDVILYFDDLSDDRSREIANGYKKVLDISPPSGFTGLWGDELRYRRYLFDRAWNEADIGDVLFWEDADMTPSIDPTAAFEQEDVNQWSFPLLDLWGEDDDHTLYYRLEPPYWVANLHPRIWAVRKIDFTEEWQWNERGIHVGHLPLNFPDDEVGLVGAPILHYGYLDPRDRETKQEKYVSVKHQLSQQELAHALTITDENPTIWPIDFEPQYRLKRAR